MDNSDNQVHLTPERLTGGGVPWWVLSWSLDAGGHGSSSGFSHTGIRMVEFGVLDAWRLGSFLAADRRTFPPLLRRFQQESVQRQRGM